jgi:hypothetical protein
VRSGDGQIVEERAVARRRGPPIWPAVRGSRAVVETYSEAFWVADAALAVGHEVRVVPATLVRSLGVGARRLKTCRAALTCPPSTSPVRRRGTRARRT